MKIAVIIARVLLGVIYVFFSAIVLFNLNLFDAPPPSGAFKAYMEGITASGYLMKFIKITEFVCGLVLISGRFAPLATVIIFPVSINILFTHAFTVPGALPIGITIMALNLFLAYAYRKNYATLVMAKPIQ